MIRAQITLHALEQAMARWSEPNLGAARTAIQWVLRHGQPDGEPTAHGGQIVHCGSRQIVITDGTVVTVHLHRPRRIAALLRQLRRDRNERAQGRSPRT